MGKVFDIREVKKIEIFKGDGGSYKSFWLEIKDCCKIIDIFFISQVNNWPNEKQLEHQLKSKF